MPEMVVKLSFMSQFYIETEYILVMVEMANGGKMLITPLGFAHAFYRVSHIEECKVNQL